MKANEFIKKHCLDRAKIIVKEAFMYPCIAFDIATNSYIFKQCESAPFSFSNYENAWSEEYAIEPVYLDKLKKAIADVEGCQ